MRRSAKNHYFYVPRNGAMNGISAYASVRTAIQSVSIKTPTFVFFISPRKMTKSAQKFQYL